MMRKRIPFNQIGLGLRRNFILTAFWREGATGSIQLLEAGEEETQGIRKFRFGLGQQPSSNSLEWFCAWADPSRFESARWLKTNSIGWGRRNPTTAPGRGTQPEGEPQRGFAGNGPG